MKALMASLLLFISTQIFPSGTSIGNGFAPVLQAASLKTSKTNEKLCTDIKDAKLEKQDGEDVCRLKDGTIKLKDLIEAAQKNDQKK